LLLTIAAQVYFEKGTLPERRSALYGQFVDIWLAEAEQRGLKAELGERMCKVAKFGLAKLALAMTEQLVVDHLGSDRPLDQLSQVTAAYLRDALHLSDDEAETDGRKFIQVTARRSGVFTRYGNAYGFVHYTFREYLAAYAIVRECKKDSKYDLGQVWERVVSRWAEEGWREVALFVLSLLNDQNQDIVDITALVERINLSIGLHFVADVLAERIRVEDRLGNAVIDELITIARRMSGWYVEIEPNAVTLLSRLGDCPRAVKGLLALARDEKVTWWVRVNAARAMEKPGQAEEAAQAWLALARDEKGDSDVREQAAKRLGRLGGRTMCWRERAARRWTGGCTSVPLQRSTNWGRPRKLGLSC
jgi:hypothetical protein